jgi:hypothetical protein
MQTRNSAPPRSSTASPSRRIRRDGWTTDRQVKFIIALNKTRSVTRAAAAAGMSRESAYRLRDRPGHSDFARAWDAAVANKGHRSPAERHAPARDADLRSPRESHESHADDRFDHERPSCPLPGVSPAVLAYARLRARGTANFGNFRPTSPAPPPFTSRTAILGDLEPSAE